MRLKHPLLSCILCMAFVGTTYASTLTEGQFALSAKRFEDAIRIFEPLANAGNPEAQRLLGEMCLQGQGMQANPLAAFKWTQLSADRGNRVAEFNMGYLYEHGLGTPHSMELALKWYTRSANKQYFLAAHRLGDFYANSDRSAAIHWYNEARLSGDENASKKFAALTLQEVKESNKRQAQEEKERKEKADAEFTRNPPDEVKSPPVNYAAAIAASMGSVMDRHAAMTQIHNQAVANTASVIAERQRREQEQHRRELEQTERQRQERREAERRAAVQEAQAQAEKQLLARTEANGRPPSGGGTDAPAPLKKSPEAPGTSSLASPVASPQPVAVSTPREQRIRQTGTLYVVHHTELTHSRSERNNFTLVGQIQPVEWSYEFTWRSPQTPPPNGRTDQLPHPVKEKFLKEMRVKFFEHLRSNYQMCSGGSVGPEGCLARDTDIHQIGNSLSEVQGALNAYVAQQTRPVKYKKVLDYPPTVSVSE